MENLVNNPFVKLFVILLAAFSPFIYMLTCGEQISISSYWETQMQPMFIFVNASTSYFLFSIRNWWTPAFLLMLLTAFSVTQFYWTHNIFAILFFVFSGVSIIKSKIKWYIFPYLCAAIPLIFNSILWAEIVGILVICSFHLHRYIKFNSLDSTRKKLNERHVYKK